ncbi:hypothetical protein F5Y15DRAFT_206301 [Xylariaceae sp. FL0016]|nr:hypothetical protein F5Y15DRAFT_206301 [Xylariaceae sp. FL0016]
MALAAAYKQFLDVPDASLLADEAALHYVTTTTSFRGPADIIKHLTSTRNHLKKKKQEFLSSVVGTNAVVVEVDTVIEFTTSGTPYLPNLDDNFLADRTVYLPITHFVTFDVNGKIFQIRQLWDQGSLLKQLDVIGKTGRNWPIRDSKEQLKMIENCVKAAGVASNGVPATSTTSRAPGEVPIRSRDTSANVLRDPHASLSLFGSRDELDQNIASVISPKAGIRPRQRNFDEILGNEADDAPASPSSGRGRTESPSKAVAPKSGVKPRQRDFSEIFGDEANEEEDNETLSRGRSQSPSKAIAPKAGAGKHYQPSRLFDTAEEAELDNQSTKNAQVPDHSYRPNPKKYQHFEFADGSDAQDAPRPGDPTPQKTKHSSQWAFDDFASPEQDKPIKSAMRKNDVRHWGTEEDSVPETPARKVAPAKPRRDAEPHFEFVDDGTPKDDPRPVRPRGSTHNNGLGLYENNVYDESGKEDVMEDQRPLGAITNLKDRGRDFAAHWEMNDDPSASKSTPKGPIADDRRKVVKMMEANWSSYDKSPQQKENAPIVSANGQQAADDRGIAIAGDGMGGSKGSNRNWFFGEDDEENQGKQPVPGRKQGNTKKSGGFNWDF